MTQQRWKISARFGVCVGLCLMLAVGLALGEVGVSIQPSGTGDSRVTSAYILGLTDDPDPVTGSWLRQNADSTSRRILNDQGRLNGDGRPHLSLHAPLETPIVVWARSAPAGFEIVVSWFDRTGTEDWTSPVVIATTPNLTADAEPVGLLDPATGAFHVFWWEDELNPRVMHSQAPSDLSSWSVAGPISPPGDLAVRPSATFHDGVLHVTYESHNGQLGGTPRLIVVGAEDGGLFQFESIASTSHASPNRPVLHTAPGRIWVDWVDATGQMSWTRRQGSASWEPVLSESFSDTEEREFRVRETIKGDAID